MTSSGIVQKRVVSLFLLSENLNQCRKIRFQILSCVSKLVQISLHCQRHFRRRRVRLMVLWRISRHRDLDGNGGLRAAWRWHERGFPIVYFRTLVGAPIALVARPLKYEEF